MTHSNCLEVMRTHKICSHKLPEHFIYLSLYFFKLFCKDLYTELCVSVFEAGNTHTQREGGKDRGYLKLLTHDLQFFVFRSNVFFLSPFFSPLSIYLSLQQIDEDVKGSWYIFKDHSIILFFTSLSSLQSLSYIPALTNNFMPYFFN